eukprot:TRINITY_DN56917_c0_g2_i3.p1 TRINITY_DN56917_c0_g2~~TRINITY_DN56917_c0_g2_i3.p1  ORF type:complete len:967 (-),score=220.46 TRINITY_DN56917_c0_g2_i3:547-3447(-)
MAAAVAAGVFAASSSAFGYNKARFQFDAAQQQLSSHMQMNFRLARWQLFREDVREMFNLTTANMNTYAVKSTLLLGFGMMFVVVGTTKVQFPREPPWLIYIYGNCLFSALAYGFLSIWLSMHCTLLANSSNVKVLTQAVRPHIPDEKELAAVRASVGQFERSDVSEILRPPNLLGVLDTASDTGSFRPAAATESNALGGLAVEAECHRPGPFEVPSFEPPGSSLLKPKQEESSRPLLAAAPVDTVAEAEDMQKRTARARSAARSMSHDGPGDSAAEGRHVRLVKRQQMDFACYDAYSRVCLTLTLSYLLMVAIYFIAAHLMRADKEDDRMRRLQFLPWSTCGMLAMTQLSVLKLDFFLSRFRMRALLTLTVMAPATVTCAMQSRIAHDDAEYAFHNVMPHNAHYYVAMVSCLLHLAWLLLVLDCAKPGEGKACVPQCFRTVRYLDVFGWLLDNPAEDALAARRRSDAGDMLHATSTEASGPLTMSPSERDLDFQLAKARANTTTTADEAPLSESSAMSPAKIISARSAPVFNLPDTQLHAAQSGLKQARRLKRSVTGVLRLGSAYLSEEEVERLQGLTVELDDRTMELEDTLKPQTDASSARSSMASTDGKWLQCEHECDYGQSIPYFVHCKTGDVTFDPPEEESKVLELLALESSVRELVDLQLPVALAEALEARAIVAASADDDSPSAADAGGARPRQNTPETIVTSSLAQRISTAAQEPLRPRNFSGLSDTLSEESQADAEEDGTDPFAPRARRPGSSSAARSMPWKYFLQVAITCAGLWILTFVRIVHFTVMESSGDASVEQSKQQRAQKLQALSPNAAEMKASLLGAQWPHQSVRAACSRGGSRTASRPTACACWCLTEALRYTPPGWLGRLMGCKSRTSRRQWGQQPTCHRQFRLFQTAHAAQQQRARRPRRHARRRRACCFWKPTGDHSPRGHRVTGLPTLAGGGRSLASTQPCGLSAL